MTCSWRNLRGKDHENLATSPLKTVMEDLCLEENCGRAFRSLLLLSARIRGTNKNKKSKHVLVGRANNPDSTYFQRLLEYTAKVASRLAVAGPILGGTLLLLKDRRIRFHWVLANSRSGSSHDGCLAGPLPTAFLSLLLLLKLLLYNYRSDHRELAMMVFGWQCSAFVGGWLLLLANYYAEKACTLPDHVYNETNRRLGRKTRGH